MSAAAPDTHLRRRLSSFETLLLTLSRLLRAFPVYGPGADVLRQNGTGAAARFELGIAVASVWGMVYGELGSAYPYAGGDELGGGSIHGPAAGFASVVLRAAIIPPTNAYLAKLIGTYSAQVLLGIARAPIAYGSILLALAAALLAVRISARLTGVFLTIALAAGPHNRRLRPSGPSAGSGCRSAPARARASSSAAHRSASSSASPPVVAPISSSAARPPGPESTPSSPK